MKFDLDNLLPSCPGGTDIQHIELGEHRYPALVVDGFYHDPDHVRALALAYPLPEAMEKESGACQFFRVEQRPHESPHPPSSRPHADPKLLAGSVYLTPPEHCRGGTSFFRHKATGAEGLLPVEVFEGRPLMGRSPADPALRDRLWQHGACEAYERHLSAGHVPDYAGYWKQLMNTPGDEHDHIVDSCGGWELTRLVEMKYNRLLLIPGFAFHSTHFRNDWFGDTPETWRLTNNFMFTWPPHAGAQ